jgi:hypothetical protein
MVTPRAIPTSLPQKPSDLPTSDNKGLSVGATVGIGIGIALLVILGAIGAWVFVRRRRRTWAKKRREQGDPELKGDTPNAEIAKKMKMNDEHDSLNKEMGVDGVPEIGGGAPSLAELDDHHAAEKDIKPYTNSHTDEKAYEMPSTIEPVEMGEGRVFVAELEGSSAFSKQV